MRPPIFNVLSLVVPAAMGVYLFVTLQAPKQTGNLGQALGPLFAVAIGLTLAALVGEVAAWIAVARGEGWRWLSWTGVVVNGLILAPVLYLVVAKGG